MTQQMATDSLDIVKSLEIVQAEHLGYLSADEAKSATTENGTDQQTAHTVAYANMKPPVDESNNAAETTENCGYETEVDEPSQQQDDGTESSELNESSANSDAKTYAAAIIDHCQCLHEAKNRPLKLMMDLYSLERAGGFSKVDCADGKEFHKQNLKSLISVSAFYRYCAAANFAFHNSIEVTEGTIKALNAIAEVNEKYRDQIWNDSKTGDDALVPKPKKIRELEILRKAKERKGNASLDSCANTEPQNSKPSQVAQKIFAEFKNSEAPVLQDLGAEIASRIQAIKDDTFQIQSLSIPELTELSELVDLTLKERTHTAT